MYCGLSATKRNHQSSCQASQMTVVKLSLFHHSNKEAFAKGFAPRCHVDYGNFNQIWTAPWPPEAPYKGLKKAKSMTGKSQSVKRDSPSRPPRPRPPLRPPSKRPLPLPPEKPPLPESGPLEVFRSTFSQPPAASVWSASADAFCKETVESE